MLKKKHFLLTLAAGITLFLILFIISYYFIISTSAVQKKAEDKNISRHEDSVDVSASMPQTQEETVQMDTHVHVVVVDEQNNTIEDKNIDPLTLLGLTETALKDRFKEYELTTFNEKEVAFKEVLKSSGEEAYYTLGVQEDQVCIVQNAAAKQYIKLDISTAHFSGKVYSMLLKEQIEITPDQKEALLSRPSYIEEILQSYEEE